MDFSLRFQTPPEWTEAVMEDFDSFLLDHAAAEKKASSMAMTMISHYPDRAELVNHMADLAIEELNHYREVVKIIYNRGLQLAPDAKDDYVNAFRKHIRRGPEHYFLDRLVIAGIIEARGHERFGLIADALPEGTMKSFYQAITTSEERHFELFLSLAKQYHDSDEVDQRTSELLDAEASIVKALPIQAALH